MKRFGPFQTLNNVQKNDLTRLVLFSFVCESVRRLCQRLDGALTEFCSRAVTGLIFDNPFYLVCYLLGPGSSSVSPTSAPKRKRDPRVCLSVTPSLGGGAATHRRSPSPVRPVLDADRGHPDTGHSGTQTSQGRVRQHALPRPSLPDSPLPTRMRYGEQEGERGDNIASPSYLPPHPKKPQTKSQERPPATGRPPCRRARAGATALPPPGPLHCLFCCQRTYLDVSCRRF